MLGLLFSSTYSAFDSLIEIECLELCDYGDMDTEEEKNENEKDQKVKMRPLRIHHLFGLQEISMAELIFLQSHQFSEINTPPPEFHS